MTRLEANREILKLLAEFFEYYPDQRFVQGLINLNVLCFGGDNYYDEAEVTLAAARHAFEELKRANHDFSGEK